MRVINYDGRLALDVNGRAVDVEDASGGRFGPEPQGVFAVWDDFAAWAAVTPLDAAGTVGPLDPALLGAPSPLPPQVFAIGLNYQSHVAEAGVDPPTEPFVFTKFPASTGGPYDLIELSSESVDWEAELVAIISRRAERVRSDDAWAHIAGLTIGQDLSDRSVQLSGPAPQQYCLGKSFRGYVPIGPALVTADELPDPNDLLLTCSLPEGVVQQARTSDLVFPVGDIVAYISHIVPLLPGDVIFTGTPAGIGWTRDPRRTLTAADELVTSIEGIGEMRHRFRTPADQGNVLGSWRLPTPAVT